MKISGLFEGSCWQLSHSFDDQAFPAFLFYYSRRGRLLLPRCHTTAGIASREPIVTFKGLQGMDTRSYPERAGVGAGLDSDTPDSTNHCP